MRNLLSPEGPLMSLLTKIAYSAYLNVLWFICCLPIVTAGASTTALFYVTLKIAKNEEGSLTRAFFHSFKENFKQATKIWLILLGLGIALAVDGYVFYHMRFENAFWTVGTAVFLVALVAYAIVLMYIFPLLARFNNTTFAMFRNSIMIGMRFLLCTALMAVIYFVMAFVVINVFTPAVIFGEGLCALLCSYLLSNILLMCEEKTDEPTDDRHDSEDAVFAEADESKDAIFAEADESEIDISNISGASDSSDTSDVSTFYNTFDDRNFPTGSKILKADFPGTGDTKLETIGKKTITAQGGYL